MSWHRALRVCGKTDEMATQLGMKWNACCSVTAEIDAVQIAGRLCSKTCRKIKDLNMRREKTGQIPEIPGAERRNMDYGSKQEQETRQAHVDACHL